MAEIRYTPTPSYNANEELVAQAITDGTYFRWNETPSGSINSVNKAFTLAANPNPTGSLELRLNGLILRSGSANDFTLSGGTITMVLAPQTGDTLTASYVVSPI